MKNSGDILVIEIKGNSILSGCACNRAGGESVF